MDRLFVSVLGHSNSGKSHTWNSLFGRTVKTGKQSRHLRLLNGECCEVFLISGSPEEREVYAGDILDDQDCRIVLCSTQYTETVMDTYNYVVDERFDIFVQWLNPGYSDAERYYDRMGLGNWLLANNAVLSMRNGKTKAKVRTEEIRQYIHGWANARKLTFDC